MRTEIEIANDWLKAKDSEEKAKLERIAFEEELIAILGNKEEGSKTHTFDDYKITITGRLSRKIDWKAYEAIKGNIPESLRPEKTVLDETGVKYLQNNEPQIYKILAPALTVEKAKTGVSIKVGE